MTALVVCVVVAVCFLTDPFEPVFNDVLHQNGYLILSQNDRELALTVPKDFLPDEIYTAEGYEFDEGQVVAYSTDTTTVWLRKVMLSNESPDQLYFAFDISYDIAKKGTILSIQSRLPNDQYTYRGGLRSKDLRDNNTVYPGAVNTRGHGPGSQFWFYVSTDACKQAEGTLYFEVVLNEIEYEADQRDRSFSMSGENVSDLNPEAIVERILDIENIDNSGVYMNSMNFSLQVDSDFNWADSQAITYFFTKSKTTYKGQLRIFPHEEKHFLTEHSVDQEQQSIFLLRHYLEAIKYLPQDAIRQMAPADRYIIEHREEGRPSYYDRVITYSSDGVQPIDGWYIHLRIQPLHADGGAFSGTGEEVIELFYGSSNGKYSDHAEMWFDFTAAVEKIDYTDEMKCTKNEFPGITFKYTPYEIAASTSWENDDTAERTVLISGMPIWNAYFCDLTGDGLPEICSQVSYGSGIIDNRVIIYDYANGVSYSLIDRGYHDYYLRMNDADGYLYVDKYTYNSDELVSSGRLVFKNDTLQLEEESSNSQVYPNFSGNLNLGLNAEIIDIDYDQKILYVKDIDESAAVFGDRCAVDCSYAISRYNLCYVNYGDPNDVITIDFSTFMIGDDVIIGMYESEKKNSFNGSAVAEQLQLSTQRLSSEVAFEFNFAGNTSGGQKMELTEEKPYWCITVVNEGTNGINIDILGTIYMVDAGSTGHIYPDKAWEPGTYSVFIGTAGGIGMEGYAICSISAAPFQEEEPLAKKISSAERLSEHPLVAYISSEWAVDKKPENVELPFNHLLIKEDGSGSIDGVDVTWDICEKYTSKEGLHIELWDDNEYVVSVVYWRDSQLLQIVDQNDNLLECYYHRIAYATG